MTTLEVILDEAEHHPFRANDTVLSDEQFSCVRAPSSAAYRARLDAALAGPGDLTEAEKRNSIDGLEVVNPVQGGIHGGYWYLHNISSRGEAFPAGELRYHSITEALAAAIEWWEAETACRGVMVRKFYCTKNGAASPLNGF